jgi:hypothetical protein
MAVRWIAQAKRFVLLCTRALPRMQEAAALRALAPSVALAGLLVLDDKRWPLTTGAAIVQGRPCYLGTLGVGWGGVG